MIINILFAIMAGVLAGILFKGALLKKYKKRVLQLENEMLNNHARILALEKKNADLEREMKEPKLVSVEEYKRAIV